MKRNIRKSVKFTSEELTKVKENAEKCKLKVATYMRQMALNGIIKVYDPYTFSIIVSRLSGIGNNINQIAKVANSTGSIYEKDVTELRESTTEVRRLVDIFFTDLRYEAV